ncbi:methyltransferase domain-containing protein [Methylocystis sp. B8]|uniref:protein-L-isoaspartate O-methyltransferase family protein n=1 Tax=Methylocystis sp. B8 TaxID=544938 RepID=UPI0010FE7060|nr:methyltransferase domain-containing protein [Methylocystis sp. B8]TLG75136.1 protein-L-isoaspartate(D-aspartate) O-methyltransferase [Methylocystis sp. B8]
MTDERRAPEIEERAALLLTLRQAGVRDLAVLRAIEATPREAFAPYRFRDLANRNLSLPIGCGQTMSRPVELARRLEALRVGRGHRVLEVGAGSGYGAAALAQLAREVVSLERFETLAIEASRRLVSHGVTNAKAIYADGLDPPRDLGRFDRIVVQASVIAAPAALIEMLTPGGLMLFARREHAMAGARAKERLIKVDLIEGGELRETDFGPCRLGPAIPGLAQAL